MTFDDLKSRSQSELDDLFRQSPAGPIPDGDTMGQAIVCPGTFWSRLIARFVHALAWQGKVFTKNPDGYFRLGPVPEGTPVNLLANLDPDTDKNQLVDLCLKIKATLARVKAERLDSAAAKELMKKEIAPALFAASKCPDLIEDRGHLFGTKLADDDKRALIEYLKTL